ncbi:MAG: DUF4177 domain-containing protein [Pseudomonadota bacterium]
MQSYEFKVIPAPRRGIKARGVKTTEDRFALALTEVMNDLGRDGWDYVRADALPCDERTGLTGTKTTFQNMLVFRRPLAAGAVPTPMAVSEVETPALMLRATMQDDAPPLRLGVSATAPEGAAPAIGPAKMGVAAE